MPTLKEAGVDGVEVVVWYGLFAPAATPRDVVTKLAEAIARAARSPDTAQRLVELGAEPVGNTPAEYAAYIKRAYAHVAKVVKASGSAFE